MDADGDGNYTDATDLDQDRTHDLVNEITGITEQADPQQTQWADPVWDARGNMKTVPKPSDLTATYAATYDAWNRLAFVWVDSNSDGDHDAGETVIARYEYDGLNRRTKKHLNADTDDDFDEFQHFFYNAAWQILETRDADDVADEPEDLQPEYQHVWSLRYIDAAVLRDKNTDDDDLCDDQRLYFTNDANMNVTALLDTDGTVLERYMYDPYGKVTVLDADFSADADGKSDYDNNILFCGYYYDWETGLYSVRRRPYHPPLGRWPSRDRRYYDNPNSYAYARSNPVGLVDPFGLFGSEAHRTMTEMVMVRQGVGPNLSRAITAANVASDNPLTFISPWSGGPSAHALSYSAAADYTASGRAMKESEREAQVIREWHRFVETTQTEIINKLTRNCCDCSVVQPLGRLTHAWQDKYFHRFESWIGWHWMPCEENVPCGEEESLDEILGGAGAQKIQEYMKNAEQTRKDPNAAVAALPSAVGTTGKVIESIEKAVGEDCWRIFLDYCERKYTPTPVPVLLVPGMMRTTGLGFMRDYPPVP